ncbi:hypothetical protein [Verrucomicrobium spinosum]|uniref:hypothetical protein n=1 Tax=Verrucomicrobium spinosum TaxID=2736 RepID=UPI00049262DA|nr:hypothetical protein [Verrucomicrobium spinosum]
MKTSVGLVMIAFATEELAFRCLKAMQMDTDYVTMSPEEVLQSKSDDMNDGQKILLFPSVEVVRDYLRDRSGFPYRDFVMTWQRPMPPCPEKIEGATVVLAASIKNSKDPCFAFSRLTEGRAVTARFRGLAIARFDLCSTEEGVLLFARDAGWNVVNRWSLLAIDDAMTEGARSFGVDLSDWRPVA